MATQRIPVILVTGFLGSGKTTMLNHLMRDSADTRIGVIVNDFGSINIDALAVAGQVDSMIPIENGCLCCAADATEMDEMLERLTDPELRIDVVVIEASGLAEPQSMIRALLSSSNERIVYGGLVEVVDAAEFPDTRVRHPELDRHVRAADLIVLNKTDRVAEGERRGLLEALQEIAPGAPVVAAAHGRVDPALLFDHRPRETTEEGFRQLSFADVWADEASGAGCGDDSGCHGHDHGDHLHAAYESVEFSTAEPLHPRRLMDFLDSRPVGLYRAKGFLHFAGAGREWKFGLHAVGSYLRFQLSPWERGEPRTTQLVMIGTGIDADTLTKRLAECVAAPEEEIDETHMMSVLRYANETD
ncbi:CobW family GTP-binding protein [Streptomyces iranensis]|uniref:Cobalamin synthesis protein P47K n=1 Tax=Streptomyces iranensis TaxID=576784 RepID=A0A060ZCZ6_9ACTN|nr:CobW family GTP-binding protein [Streptomyces iranensis]MBP2067054.1 G3E family GTPase [Streptomyces iranensis]CDR02607.1 cobalamin synthesis protein P47K [Streptomyces iranensis]